MSRHLVLTIRTDGEVNIMKGKLSRLTRRSGVGIGGVLVLTLSLGTGWLTLARADDTKAEAKVEARVISNFTVTLLPGVLHGFVLGPVSANRGYLVEVSPLNPADNGASIQSFVEPESNGVA